MDKNVEISILYELYKGLLTEKQSLAVEYYYNDDLSLGEIAENLGITRQGVRDALLRAEDILKDAESKIGMLSKTLETEKVFGEISQLCKEGESSTDEKARSIFAQILDRVHIEQDGEDAYGI